MNLLLPHVCDFIDCVALGLSLGITIHNWFFYFLRKLHPLNIYTGICVSILTYIISFIIHKFYHKKTRKVRPISIEGFITFSLLFTLIFIFALLSYLRDAIFSTGTVYSDIPFHMALISSIAYGANSGTDDFLTPFYSDAYLRYPFLPDFHSSVLISTGNGSMRTAIAIPTLMMFTSFLLSMFSLFRYFSRERFVPELGCVFWFVASGVGWKWYLHPNCRNSMGANFVHSMCGEETVFWIHPFIHFLMPQRSAVYSMPINIYIILLLNIFIDSDMKDWKAALSAGVIMGTLPMISAHSFIAIGEYAIFLCILNFHWISPKRWVKDVLNWAIYGFTAIFIALPQIIKLLSGPKRTLFSWEALWKERKPNANFFDMLRVWWMALGGFIIIALFFVWPILNSHQRRIYMPSIFVFLLANYLRYQPGAMDNTKIFFATWYPLACVCVSLFFVTNFKTPSIHRKKIIPLLIFAFFFMSISSILCMYRSSFPAQLWSKNTASLGRWFIDYAQKNTSILSSMWHSNPAMAIGGHLLYMGYPGWVWTHGFDLNRRIYERNYLFDNMDAIPLFHNLNISYITINYLENDLKQFKPPERKLPWMQIFGYETVQVFKLIG